MRPAAIQWPFCIVKSLDLLPFQCLTHPFSLVLTMIEKHLGRKVLYVEDLDVHSSEEDQVFTTLQGLLGKLISIL